VKQHASSDIVVYLIGNRCDLEEEREVTKDRAIEFCQQYGIDKFFETSAKTGDNVEEVFSLAAKELYMQQKELQKEEEESATAGGQNEAAANKSDQRGGETTTKVNLNKKKAGTDTGNKEKKCC